MRHDIVKGSLRRAIHGAGVASTLDPTLCRLPGLQSRAYGGTGGTEAVDMEASRDILLALESRMSVLDVSIMQPSAGANRAAAAMTDGAAAVLRDRKKRLTYGRLDPNGSLSPRARSRHRPAGLGDRERPLPGSH
jgi:hypothetical protein